MESGQWEELLASGRGPWEPQSWHLLPRASLVQALLCCATQGQFLTHAGPQPHVCKEGHWEGCFRRGELSRQQPCSQYLPLARSPGEKRSYGSQAVGTLQVCGDASPRQADSRPVLGTEMTRNSKMPHRPAWGAHSGPWRCGPSMERGPGFALPCPALSCLEHSPDAEFLRPDARFLHFGPDQSSLWGLLCAL